MDLIFVLNALDSTNEVCKTLMPIMTLLGYVIFGIKVLVPIALVLIGMIDLSKAILGKDENDIKKAQSSLIKKLVIGICIFLLVTVVGLIMNLIGNTNWDKCTKCALDVFGNHGVTCEVITSEDPTKGQ